MEKLSGFFKQYIEFDNPLLIEMSKVNIHRIYSIGIIFALVNIFHIILFAVRIPEGPENVVLWYRLVIIIHTMMLVVNTIVGVIAYNIEKKQKQSCRYAFIFQPIVIILNLIFGIALCISDQLVTSNINPLLVVSVAVGVIFLFPPILSIFLYTLTFLLFFVFVPITQGDPSLVDHLRVNSISATGLGLGLSIVMWRLNTTKIQQQKIIEEQNLILHEKNQYLQYLSEHDPLTRLPNRNRFMKAVEKVNKKRVEENVQACIILLDIDFFKYINDNHGHPAGDQVLKEIAEIIISVIRKNDISARIGGEEFIILLSETSVKEAEEIAEKIRMKIQHHTFYFEEAALKITASFGVADLNDSFQVVYGRADEALYQAKKDGRNCAVVAEV